MGLVAVLLLGVGSVFILFSVFAVCYRLARSCIRVSKFDVIVPQNKLGVLNVDLLLCKVIPFQSEKCLTFPAGASLTLN